MKRIIILLCLICLFLDNGLCQAQIKKVVSGVVRDESNQPISGAIISIPNKDEYTTSTDIEGKFLLEIPKEENTLICHFIGYRNQSIKIITGHSIEINLKLDIAAQDALLNVALLQTERRGSYTGAISTVKEDELTKSPTAGFTASLAGRLAGLTSISSTSTPGNDAPLLYIRGLNSINGNTPLIVLDGIPSPLFDMNTLSAYSIESVSILKDAASKALYGPRASSGVILITTKHGQLGRTKVNVNMDYSIQQATQKPKTVNSYQYARLRNQALINDGNNPLYTLYDEAGYADGSLPNTNWYNMFMDNMASMQRFNLNISGGNNKVKYLINAGYMHQNSLVDAEKQEKYNPALKLHRFNIISNIDVALHRYLSCYLNTNISIDRLNQGYSGIESIMSNLYNMPPTIAGPTTKDGKIITTEYNENPSYGMINKSGYTHTTGINLNVAYGMKLDLDFLIKGLSTKGVIGYEANYSGNIYGSTDYPRYSQDGNSLFGTHTQLPLSLTKNSDMRYFMNFQGFINYDRVFGRKHELNAFICYFNEDMMKNGDLPYDRLSLIGHAKYGYDSRYYIQGDFSYDGTEQFKPNHRFKFSPTLSAAWIASNENFLKKINWLNFLKLRASVGWLANDQISNTRFLYSTDVRYGLSGYLLSNYYAAHTIEGQQGNPSIFYEKSFQQNYGLDLTLFNSLSLSFDYWYVKQSGMALQDTSISMSQGISSSYLPYENLGKMNNKGFDMEISYTKKLSFGLDIAFKGNIGYNKNKLTDVRELNRKSSGYYYPHRKTGYSLGQQFGYLIDYSNGNGYYNSQQAIDNSKLSFTGVSPRVGDFVYKDLNNDGIIDERDQAPMKDAKTLPTISYGTSIQLGYKNVDLYVQIQGISGTAAYYNGCGIFENFGHGVYTNLHKQAWTAARYANNEKITYPALSTGNSSSLQSNEFFYSKNNYLRLKNVAIGYTIPKSLTNKMKIEKMRFYISGENLLTTTSLKFDNLDPEQKALNVYPIYRTFSIGLNLNF